MIQNLENASLTAIHTAPQYMGREGSILSFNFTNSQLSVCIASENVTKKLIEDMYVIDEKLNNEFFIELMNINHPDPIFKLHLHSISCDKIRIPCRYINSDEIIVDFFNYGTIYLRKF